MTAGLNPQLARIAREHDGLVTRAHAAARGVAPQVLRAAVRAGHLKRLRPGLFVTTQCWAEAPHRSDQFVLTVRGILLAHPTWIASHHAALALHGLPLHDVDLGVVDVAAPVRVSRIEQGLHVHVASHDHLEATSDLGLRVIPPAQACVLTAAASGLEAGVVAMDAALHRRLVTHEDLVVASALKGARYGIGMVRAAIAATDPACESPGESRTRLLLRAAGLDVRSQVAITDQDGFIGRVDFVVGNRVVVEFDGAVKYDGLDGKRELMKEKAREERLRDAGYRIVRVTWADLSRPEQLLRRIRGQLAA